MRIIEGLGIEELNGLPEKRERNIAGIIGSVLFFLGAGFCVLGTIEVVSAYADFIDNLNTLPAQANPTGEIPRYFRFLLVGIPLLGLGFGVRIYATAKGRHQIVESQAKLRGREIGADWSPNRCPVCTSDVPAGSGFCSVCGSRVK